MTIELTETQRLLLSAAAERDDRCLISQGTLKGGALQKVAAKLIAAGLIKEIFAKPGLPPWRRDKETGRAYSLKATASGVKAIAGANAPSSDKTSEVDDAAPQRKPTAKGDRSGTPLKVRAGMAKAPGRKTTTDILVEVSSPRSGTKIAQVVDLLNRTAGATIEELTASTDWLPHTARAALTGLRKRGYVISIDRSDQTRGPTYRIGGNGESQAVVIAAKEIAGSAPVRRPRRAGVTISAPARPAA
jgi:Protein of unknown function (DUF3489)